MVNVGVEWINQFPSPCSAPSMGHDNCVARGFGSGMQSRGHKLCFDWGNADAWETDWRDPYFGGHDDNSDGGADSVDFACLATHGVLDLSDYLLAAFGAKHDKCFWDNREGRLGNKHIKWLYFDSCESLKLPKPHYKWHHCFYGLHMVFGFAGSASDGWPPCGRGSSFGERAGQWDTLSQAWMDEGHSWWCDDTPVAMSCGRTSADAMMRLLYENIGWSSEYLSIPHDQIKWYAWCWRT